MDTPITELLLNNDLLELVREGKKLATVRKGKRNIGIGELTLRPTNAGPDLIKVNVNQVVYKTLNEITEEDAKIDGYVDRESLIERLKAIYPDIQDDTTVTIIYFQLAERSGGG